ncbi:MAG: GNAT family N-acetyltransferase [Helicobacteraceae bacterium]|nr:GNAT family N-acetyltransferase [Helicobacteraceae bacterium]
MSQTHTTSSGLEILVLRQELKSTKSLNQLAKGTVVTLTTDPTCKWWIAIHESKAVGVVCAKDMGNGKYRMKSDIVAPEYRGEGIYRLLSEQREEWCKEQGATELNCFSSSYSRSTFEHQGYIIEGDDTKDNVFMKKQLDKPTTD